MKEADADTRGRSRPKPGSHSVCGSEAPAIRTAGLGKCYEVYKRPQDRLLQFLAGKRARFHREFWALRDVSVEVPRGKTVGIIGRNGAGKTTLLQLIAGTLAPTTGEISVDGRVTALLELGSGFNPEFTGRENVLLNGAILGIGRKEMAKRFDSIAAFADIGDFVDQPVKTYSKGMHARLAFAVMANLDPDIFIVDEALAVGDAYFKHRCMLRFHEMKARGTTILYVSHDAGAMKRLCDSVIWIHEGRLRATGEPDEIVDEYLAELFRIKQAEVAPHRPGRPRHHVPHAPEGASRESGERVIPNIDRRIGDSACTIEGVCLYDEELEPAQVVEGGSSIVLRVTARNDHLPADTRSWQIGYVLRNNRGEDIASTNTDRESVALPLPPREESLTVRFSIRVPELFPGSYSFSVGAAYTTPAGDVLVGDRIDNAVIFELTSRKPIRSLLALETRVTVEEPASGPANSAGVDAPQSSASARTKSSAIRSGAPS